MLDRAPNANKSAPAANAALPLSPEEADTLFSKLAALPGLLLAVSGGPDSIALMVLLARWRDRLPVPPRLLAVTVDHGLRPEGAQEAEGVKKLANRLGIDHRTVLWTGQKPTTGILEQARLQRYRLLGEAAQSEGMGHILTAHTKDDQAETVLFRLLCGSGLAGLARHGRRKPILAGFLWCGRC